MAFIKPDCGLGNRLQDFKHRNSCRTTTFSMILNINIVFEMDRYVFDNIRSIAGFLIDGRTMAAFESPVRISQPEILCRADQKGQQLINKLLQEECLGQGSSVHVLLVKT